VEYKPLGLLSGGGVTSPSVYYILIGSDWSYLLTIIPLSRKQQTEKNLPLIFIKFLLPEV